MSVTSLYTEICSDDGADFSASEYDSMVLRTLDLGVDLAEGDIGEVDRSEACPSDVDLLKRSDLGLREGVEQRGERVLQKRMSCSLG